MSYKTKQYGRLRVSLGNSKLGTIPNVSLPPVIACAPKIPCANECYARKAFRQYKQVRHAWSENHDYIRDNPAGFQNGIETYLGEYSPEFFRWWVSGDTPNQAFLNRIYETARRYPETRFLLFTKMHDLTYRKRPDNLAVIFSMWNNWGNTTKSVRRAWVDFGGDRRDNRVPDNAIVCPGHCETCGMCWQIDKIGRDVVFPVH